MNFNIKEELIKIMLNSKISKTYSIKHNNTKYTLSNIIDELIYVLKSGVSWRNVRSNINYKTLFWRFNNLSKNHVFRKLFYKIKRRHEDKILNLIEKKYRKDSTIIIGDWNESNKVKFISTPNMHLKRKLQERFNVYLLDEFNTSKLCYKNDTVCGNINVTIKSKYGKNKGKMINKDLHAVLTFKMEKNVTGCINRDKNSVLNFEKIVKSLIETKERPIKSRRKEFLNDKS
jgi:hypothetical protein